MTPFLPVGTLPLGVVTWWAITCGCGFHTINAKRTINKMPALMSLIYQSAYYGDNSARSECYALFSTFLNLSSVFSVAL